MKSNPHYDAALSRILAQARPNIQRLKPYASARLHANLDELRRSVLLNANENPYPPPIRLRSGQDQDQDQDQDQGQDQDQDTVWDTQGYNYYPEPQPQELLETLATLYNVDSQQLLVGRGSDEGIDLLIRAFCGEQDSMAICSPTFGMYRSYAEIQGCRIVELPLDIAELRPRQTGTASSKAALLEARLPMAALRQLIEAAEPPKLLFIPSPLAPLGSLIAPEKLESLLRLCAERNVLLVVDEAYAEFAQILEPLRYQSLVPQLSQYPNLVLLRTLSKAYSLAGERIGSLLAARQLIELLRPVQSPYPVPSSISRYVCKMLQDPSAKYQMAQHICELCQQQQELFAFLEDTPYIEKIFCSAANFIMVQVPDPICQELLQHCQQRSLILRDFSRSLSRNFSGALRISAGNADQMSQLRQAIKSFLH